MARDSSGFGSSAAHYGDPFRSWYLHPAPNGGGLDFDGVDDRVSAPDASWLDLDTDITVEAWVRLDALRGAGQRRTIVAKPGAYYLQLDEEGRFVFGIDPDAGEQFLPENELVAGRMYTGGWVHVSATFDGTDLRIYQGGWLEDERSSAAAADSAAPLHVGA